MFLYPGFDMDVRELLECKKLSWQKLTETQVQVFYPSS